MVNLILSALYFYFPAAFANMGAVIGSKIPAVTNFKFPVDFKLSFRNRRLVGNHKYLSCLLFGIAFGYGIALIKIFFLDPYLPFPYPISLNIINKLILYAILVPSAPLGDIIKSIAKRQLAIPPHQAWIPFDEIDHTLFSLFAVSIFFPLPILFIFTTIVLYFFLHIGANLIGYALKIKKVPY